MLLTSPDHDTLYRALVDRDPAYNGQIWVAVASTGIFCRLTCPARKPRRENCHFHDSISACLNAGFRPCKRCNPLSHPDPQVARLLTALDADADHRWVERDVVTMGLDPSTMRRAFQRHFGMTFLEMARLRRLGQGFSALASGDKVINAQHAAGFDSPTAFRDAFTRTIGLPPAVFRKNARIQIDWIDTTLGPMVAAADQTHLHLLEFIDRKALPTELRKLRDLVKGDIGFGRTAITDQTSAALEKFFDGTLDQFTVPLAFHGPPFTKSVWRVLQAIPPGETRTYAQIANQIQRPTATRAVARANGANQIAILIPCHRVIGADGSLTGYGGGLWRKDQLLSLEQRYQRTT